MIKLSISNFEHNKVMLVRHVVCGTRYGQDMLCAGHVTDKTCCVQDSLGTGHVVCRTRYGQDMLCAGHVRDRTCCVQDTLGTGHVVCRTR